ncbi:hypothetical protein CR513_33298, partial [Mucuna pruriens]
MNVMRELGEKLDKIGQGLGSVQKDTQRVNAKVEALSKDREERPKVSSLHESEGSFVEGNYSERSGSYQSSRGGKRERQERMERHGREDKRDKHGRRREEPKREELDLGKVWNKLQRLYQGSKSVEEYHKKMEMDLMRAQIEDSR